MFVCLFSKYKVNWLWKRVSWIRIFFCLPPCQAKWPVGVEEVAFALAV